MLLLLGEDQREGSEFQLPEPAAAAAAGPGRWRSDADRAWEAADRRAARVRPPAGPPPRLRHGMAGIVIVGAQWGDEGKGKIVDLLAENADLVIRFQGGNNAGHTIVRDDVQVEVPPDPVRDPLPGQAVRDRQRRRDRPEGADRRAGRPAREGHRPLRAADQRQRAPDHAVPHAPRPRGRGEARQAADRHHAARHRPRATPTRPRGWASASRTCSTRRSSRRRSSPRWSPSGSRCARTRSRPSSTCSR